MNNTKTDNIKEIAEQLDCGFRAFIHKTTAKLLFVPDENNLIAIDLEPWKEELEQLENNFTDYYEIDRWTSSEAFEIMSEFADQVSDNNLQSRLFDALRKISRLEILSSLLTTQATLGNNGSTSKTNGNRTL